MKATQRLPLGSRRRGESGDRHGRGIIGADVLLLLLAGYLRNNRP